MRLLDFDLKEAAYTVWHVVYTWYTRGVHVVYTYGSDVGRGRTFGGGESERLEHGVVVVE